MRRRLLQAVLFAGQLPIAHAELPVPCGGGCGAAGGPAYFFNPASAVTPVTVTQPNADSMTITQHVDQAVLNWQTFNVGRENSVVFKQPKSTSIAVNKVWDPNGDPSRILGSLSANGQVYLINRNGVVFGEGAQVNVQSLVASSLDVADGLLENGVFAPLRDGRPAFVRAPKVDGEGNPVSGTVVVEEGAALQAGSNGFIMLLAPEVENRGTLHAPDGQVILAAGDRVWIAGSNDDNLRGFVVEVDAGGIVRNFGDIAVDHGNVSLAGLAVNQSGRISATTSVSLGGSIRLVARDNMRLQGTTLTPQRAGDIEFGAGSVTEVLPDYASTDTAVDEQEQPVSTVSAFAKTIEVGASARITTTSGSIDFVATANPEVPLSSVTTGNGASIDIASGAVLDVSGTRDVVLPMERNVISVELRGNELKDSPLQRDGVLYGRDVLVDIREDTPIADISGALANIKRGIGERTTTGGTIALRSEDSLFIAEGATLDVSGGSVRYNSGVVATTKLVSEGRVYDISNADPDRTYDTVLGGFASTSSKWGIKRVYQLYSGTVEPGYVEGKDAGGMTLLGDRMTIAGNLRGETIVGDRQRQLPTAIASPWSRSADQLALGGAASFGDASQLNQTVPNFRLPSVVFRSPGEDETFPEGTLVLDPALFEAGGISRLAVYSNERIELPEDERLSLAPGGSLTLVAGSAPAADEPGGEVAPALQIDGDISIASGSVTLRTVRNDTLIPATEFDARHRIGIGSDASIDVSGTWVNDSPLVTSGVPTDAVAIDGGSIRLSSAGGIDIAEGSALLMNGGAWLGAGGGFTAGEGGDLTIGSSLETLPTLRFDGRFESYGMERGGALSLSAAGIAIAATDAPGIGEDGMWAIDPSFFQEGGFSSYALTATHLGLSVAADTLIAPRMVNGIIDPRMASAPTGTPLLTHAELLPDYMRASVDLSLSSQRGSDFAEADAHLVLGAGAVIDADVGASVTLGSDRMLIVEGTVSAPAGEIRLDLGAGSRPNEGLLADKAIWLGPDAVLAAPAAVVMTPDPVQGLRRGTVLDGGSVTLRAQRGFVVTDPGSLIDVSGVAAILDFPRAGMGGPAYQPTVVVGTAGSVNVEAPEGMLLTGGLRAQAADAPGAAAGTLAVTLGNGDPLPDVQAGALKRPAGARELALMNGDPAGLLAGLNPGDALYSAPDLAALQSSGNNVTSRAVVSLEQLSQAGFDNIDLAVKPVFVNSIAVNTARIRFDEGSQLAARGRVTLDAPVIAGTGGDALVEAGYVAIGPTDTTLAQRIVAAPSAGEGTFSARAGLIDLVGNIAIQGFGAAGKPAIVLQSTGDVRLIGTRVPDTSSTTAAGALRAVSELRIEAAQVYPTTLSQFTLEATGANSLVSLTSSADVANAEIPLSAAGALDVRASRIEVSGTVRAPHGRVTLDAQDQLILHDGAEVSVAGPATPVPFGQTQFGIDWVLPYATSLMRVVGGLEDEVWSVPVPEKVVELSGDDVQLDEGARIVLDGGGDLYAWEFIPGPGGSRDVLLDENAAGAFAVLPLAEMSSAPLDPFISSAGLEIGDTIEIARGLPGLPAGSYALLPARYALLPGAFLLTPAQGMSGLAPGDAFSTLGALPIVAGRPGSGLAGTHDSLWSGYIVENGERLRQRAEYRESLASDFFTGSTQQLPADAGSLIIDAGASLALGASVQAVALGRGGQVDIVADRLAVVQEASGDENRVELLADGLAQLHVDSLLLGGRRDRTSEGTRIEAEAREVWVESGVDLTLPEIILVAAGGDSQDEKRGITIAGGASLSGVGDEVATPSAYLLAGDAALLRVSSGDAVQVERNDVPVQTQARLVLQEGSSLTAGVSTASGLDGGTIALDSSGDASSAATLALGTDGALQFAASRISIGDVPEGGVQGLSLSQAQLASLDVSNLFLKSASSIDLYGEIDLNVSGILALDTAVLRGISTESSGSAGPQAILGAATLMWTASSTVSQGTQDADPAGSLTLAADSLRLGEADGSTGDVAYAVEGFGLISMEAGEEFVLQGTGTLGTSGDLQLSAPWLTTGNGADWKIDAAGAVAVTAPEGDAIAPTAAGLGSSLSLSGASLTVDGHMLLPAGTVSLQAKGEGDIRLVTGSLIDVAAVSETFMDQTVTSPGGQVSLSAGGDVVMEEGAAIDVSGEHGGLTIGSQGEVRLEGDLIANTVGGEDGSFTLAAFSIADFAALNQALNAGGFGLARDIHLRSGDVTIAAGETVRAREFSMVLDGEPVEEGGPATGKFQLAGTIDASGESAGSVRIEARGDVDLVASALIDAHASGEERQGGEVELGTAEGTMRVAEGARIDVSGPRHFEYTRPKLDENGEVVQLVDENNNLLFDVFGTPIPELETVSVTDTGSVRYRVSRAALLDDASRPVLAGTVTGARRVEIEALQVYTEADGRIDAGEVAASATNPLYQDAADFMAGEADILVALGFSGDPRVHLTPGIEVRSQGDLTLAAPWDLAQWRFGENGEAGVLSLRAAGNIVLQQSLSDGVERTVDQALFTEKDSLLRDASWSLRLAAGSDTGSIDPLAVMAGVGDVRLGAGAVLRTGTGDIDLRAGRDLVLGDQASTIYTGGVDAGAGTLDSALARLYLDGVYPVLGGDLDIAVGRNVEGVAGTQLINDWLWRIGGVDTSGSIGGVLPHAWNVSLTDFRQGVAAFGGGRVSVVAGGDIHDLSASLPTVGKQVGENVFDAGSGVSSVASDVAEVHGGESLTIRAGGDISGGIYYLGQGEGELVAGDSVNRMPGISALYPMLGLGAGKWSVTAGRDATVETVFNPANVAPALVQGLLSPIGTSFITYDDESALHLVAVAGEARLNQGDLIQNHPFISGRLTPQEIAQYRLYPGSVYATSLRGDVVVNRSLDLIAAPQGQMELFADGNVRGEAGSSPVITMLDLQDAPPIHADDEKPVRVVARRGDIGGDVINFNFPKAARLQAGGDIHNVRLIVQHLHEDDVTLLNAGGSIVHDTTRAATGALGSSTLSYTIAGPGRVEFLAGKDIDFGTANGVLTTGNTSNSLLPEGGAAITLVAGLRESPHFDDFVQTYLVESDNYSEALAAYLQDFDTDSVRSDLDNFLALPDEQRTPFLWQVFFAELRDSGVDATASGSGDFSRGFAAIETLFPADLYGGESSTGDITLLLSRISVLAGGDITLVAPGGAANAGVASSAQLIKQPSELGIVAQGGGLVNAFVRDDFMVNQSRVFAIGGGDILMWSSTGDIDAGRGAKSAISAPPPQVTTDPLTGATVVVYPPAISGSGIRAIETTPGKLGDVYLFAPAGVVSAGDAGIGAAGNVTIGAVEVIGADNIDVGGASVGIPVADTGALAAGFTGVSNAGSAASKSSEEALGGGAAGDASDTPLADSAFAVLDVVVLGLGLNDESKSAPAAAPVSAPIPAQPTSEDSKPKSKDCPGGKDCDA